VIPIGDPLLNGWHTEYDFKLKDNFIYEPNNLQEYADSWYLVMKMYVYGITYLKDYQQKYLLISLLNHCMPMLLFLN
jgi:hypothetical protein